MYKRNNGDGGIITQKEKAKELSGTNGFTPIISVVVPVYNVEPYLHRCIDSILAQTFVDFELILVDDGSPDNCPAICDEYAAHDSRVFVIHQTNQGLSAARNAALDYVFTKNSSTWLTFVDSDDWIHPQTLELLYHASIIQDAKIVICNHQKATDDILWEQYIPTKASLWDVEEYYISHNLNATVVWAKLYHKTCFEHVRFPVGKVHEDEYTTYKILFQQKLLVVVNLPLYAYYSNLQSITKSGNKLKWLYALSAFEEQLVYFKSINAQKAYSYRIANYYIELVLFPKQLSNIDPQERTIKLSLKSKKKNIYAQMNWHEKQIAYRYLYPRTTKLFSRIIRCIKLFKEGGISSIFAVLKHRQ